MAPLDTLLHALGRYRSRNPGDPFVDRFFALLETDPGALSRDRVVGHVTASAWVVDPSARAAVLVFHPTLRRWLQPGGHLEPNETTPEGSLREAAEETGLSDLRVDGEIFDLDIHPIPARGPEPEHLHFDVRHWVRGRVSEEPRPESPEARVRWVFWHEVRAHTDSPSVLRLASRSERRAGREIP